MKVVITNIAVISRLLLVVDFDTYANLLESVLDLANIVKGFYTEPKL